MRNMRRKWIWIAPLALVGLALFITLGGVLVMQLWNWLLPGLFGWREITFWQALGLLLLCRILFGGLGHGGGRGFRRHRMSPEERRGFRDHVHERWNSGSAPGDATQF